MTPKQIMGMGWIRVKESDHEEILNYFKSSNIGWAFSTKAEILAIYTALLTTIKNSEITIFTDSKSAINQFEQYKKRILKKEKI